MSVVGGSGAPNALGQEASNSHTRFACKADAVAYRQGSFGGARSAGRLPRVGAEQGGAVVRAEAFRRGMSQGQRAPFSQRLLEQPEPA